MAKCSKCGAENADGAKFCESCGAPLEAAALANKSFCPQCGAPLNGGNFCPSCGYKIGAPVQPTPAPAMNPYGPNPYGQTYNTPNGFAKPVERCSIVRRILANVGSFVFLGFIIFALSLEFTKGSGVNYFKSIQTMIEQFKSSTSDPRILIGTFFGNITYILPAVGVVVFGIIAIVKGLMSLLSKNVPPSYGVAGAIIGFMLPYYLVLGTATTTPDNKGFNFDVLKTSPSLTMFLVAVGVYVAIGLVNAYMFAIENKRGLVSPILKTFGVVALAVAAIFMFCPSIATTVKDSSDTLITESDSVFLYYGLGLLAIEMSSSFDFRYALILLMGLMFTLSAIEVGLAMGSIVGKNKKNSKVTPFVMILITNVLCVATMFIMNASGSGSGLQMAMPSIAAIVVIVSLLLHLVIGDISAGKDAAGA